ncbi:MAG: ATP-binding protein [Prevotellaceae bacterium]|jgi:DNA transposition AAA+ family ATPase|nr:ATP-binding protein [Prevotellaceae bacterium]
MTTVEIKKKIVEGIKQALPTYASASKLAVALGTSPSQLSRVLGGDIENVLSEAAWISIARKLNVKLTDEAEWKTAETPVFKTIYTQLGACQKQSISAIFCDNADIGKTYTARQYKSENKHVAYVDCSQVKTKQQLVQAIAREFGIGATGRYIDVYADVVYYLRTLPNPLIILDEAGDLEYKAFLELKALWNATEYCCGWYMMGAECLKAKIEANKGMKRVGYAEIFSRYGNRYQSATPAGAEALKDFTLQQVAMIAKVNCPEADVQKIYAKTGGSLRRIRTEVQKMKNNQD